MSVDFHVLLRAFGCWTWPPMLGKLIQFKTDCLWFDCLLVFKWQLILPYALFWTHSFERMLTENYSIQLYSIYSHCYLYTVSYNLVHTHTLSHTHTHTHAGMSLFNLDSKSEVWLPLNEAYYTGLNVFLSSQLLTPYWDSTV